MTDPIRVLFLGPTDAEAFDITSMERQSGAVRHVVPPRRPARAWDVLAQDLGQSVQLD
jgi:hypothetical protein